jgi:hypothetical protein
MPPVEDAAHPRATGRCLCGAVTFEVRGPLRDVVFCHCEECRRWGGHLGAFAATKPDDLDIVDTPALRWIESPASDRHARRGFCVECGSSLFWAPGDGSRVSVSAGALDPPTGLQAAGHWYTRQAADYHQPPADGLPRDADLDFDTLRWS